MALGFAGGSEVKHLPAMWETWVRSLGREDSPGEGNGNPLQDSCLENPMDGEVGYSPWTCKESDMTEQLHFLSIIYYKEGMATHSNILAWRIPMDSGAWQTIVHGVSKNWI